MHRTIVLITLSAFLFTACGKQVTDPELNAETAPEWPVVDAVASYDMDVTLDPEHKTLTGHERITYVNTGETSIHDVIFHLYLNAFRDDHSSIFMQEAGPSHRGFSLDTDHPGWTEVTSIHLEDGTPLSFELIEDETLGRLELPHPIAPGKTLILEIDFKAQLPQVFARTGFYEDFFMVGQWFPKLGVWQNDRWNAYPFHANSEFFADFGDYDVRITVPEQYVIAATGLPVSSTANEDGTQTTQFEAKGVIDFAWSASPHFKQSTRKVDGTEIVYVYLPEHEFTVERVLYAAETAVSHFGDWYGMYPYPRLTIVDVPDQAEGAGGMEYPMLVAAGLADLTGLGIMKGRLDRLLETVTVHEIAHEWWYAVVAFNEAEEPWLDEGITDYSTVRLMDRVYGPNDTVLQLGGIELDYLQMRRMEYLADPLVPMYGKAWDFDQINYGIATYSKPVLALSTLENVVGEQTMLEIMSTFFEQYKFSHPTTQDFRSVAEDVAGQKLDWFFDGLVYGDDVLNYTVTSVNEHSLTVERQGELIIPTEVEVTFEDGTTEMTAWDGVQDEMTFDYPDRASIRQAEVDPHQKILVDLQWSDNGLSRRMDVMSWLAVSARLLFQIQDFLLGQGGL
ncbi:MAG: M1 family peptidase [Chloroflexi bacterium]|nr:MAG: M1 family peptidase [Chloroflexota bacterium]